MNFTGKNVVTYSIFWLIGSSFSANIRSTIFESIPGMLVSPEGCFVPPFFTTVLFTVLFTVRLTVIFVLLTCPPGGRGLVGTSFELVRDGTHGCDFGCDFGCEATPVSRS